ncbi:hypothetical protein [Acetobacter pasteurianus]|uniref:hypothetical protein n=1 Tax=Acetobacter pasteurianus TaxID=438 RepID=UPI003D131474
MQANVFVKRNFPFMMIKYPDFHKLFNRSLWHNLPQKIFAISVIIFNFCPEKLCAETISSAYSEQDRQKDFNDADTNHDGHLSFDEFDIEVKKFWLPEMIFHHEALPCFQHQPKTLFSMMNFVKWIMVKKVI